MVQLTVNSVDGVALCRVVIPSNATVQQLLLQLAAVKPELSQAQAIRNDARGVTHRLAPAATTTGRATSATAQTLLQAGLIGQDSTAETLVLLMATGAVPSSANTVKARILELFGRAPAPSSAAVAPIAASSSSTAMAGRAAARSHTNVSPETIDERQLELQRRIYARIQQQQIDENLANALEYTPEAFAKVTMLYVPCTIHKVSVKAFVDSGAQNSIMNKRTAERCGLMRLVDVRMRGVAVGVGRQAICGRIHMVPVNLAGMYIPFAFSVIEDQPMDLIIGLDQLRRHQMLIDLRSNCLTIDSVSVPFLPECDLPASASLDVDAYEETHAMKDDSVHLPRHQDPAASSTTSTTAASASAPAAVARTSEAPLFLSDGERQARVEGLMTVAGITDPRQAAELLEAANWDANVAAALFFDT
ncbi:hypothetical protein CUR178_08498 [Leishmania enriettii]|uniref:Aspartic peptidase DDI1-type domain-containing protein n=1 Tax=Leishmania enriettii TaxID=5663 RepID=A0A836HJL0_LEIEN|nr:hypothetical protein CUR178_08498 [Leishmania enriettii]